MLYPVIPGAAPLEPYAWMDQVFSDEEINGLQHRANRAGDVARIGGPNPVDPNIRRSYVDWVQPKGDDLWIFERLADVVSDLNARFFRFDLTGFGEGIQLTNYDQSDHGMYGWHQDYNSKISRKLSVVVQLTDPTAYEGGNLEIANGPSPIAVRKQRGLVCVFPSYTLHQVTPVVRGSRQSLVAWVSGPTFR